jgi:hypothetical protein
MAIKVRVVVQKVHSANHKARQIKKYALSVKKANTTNFNDDIRTKCLGRPPLTSSKFREFYFLGFVLLACNSLADDDLEVACHQKHAI